MLLKELKVEHLIVKIHVLRKSFKKRYDHQKTVILPKLHMIG